METCKSPRKVLREAYELALPLLPAYASAFSRHDGFTEPQLFACLVLREHQKKSYRGVEALLADSPAWLAEIGVDDGHAPDHNTLWRAFGRLVKRGLMNKMLDQQVAWAESQGLIQGRVEPVALDSSMFESRHVSRHFEKRCNQSARATAKAARRAKKTPQNKGAAARMPRR
jgi:IS5 family transposase